ncbi:MAG: hypothetical protein HDQ88_02770 [Clostridia bacterium]|nr:hypothetical protein [Clostridia bacterium]
MTVIKIIDAFTFYGFDVVLLAFLTALTVQLFKATFLKRVKRKLFTFLPFILGAFYYAVYAAVKNLSLAYLLDEYLSVLEHGVSVGAVATLLYVVYEQFVREKKTSSPTEGVISTLVEGYVPDGNAEEVAKLIAEAIERDVTGSGAERAFEILKENSGDDVTERDIKLLSKLIIETLAHLNAK